MSKKKLNKNKKKPAAPKVPTQEIAPAAEVAETAETVEVEAVAAKAPAAKAGKVKKERSPLGVRIAKYATALVVVLVLFWFGCTAVVKEGSCAVILRFGAVREEAEDAGLYFKLPWPFETVVTYDDRLQTLEANRLETLTKDTRNIVIQSYVVWEIDDPVLYHNSVGSKGSSASYINDQVFSATNSTMGAYNLSALVSLHENEIKIDQIEEEIFARVHDNCLKNYGINVVDVSIERLSVPDGNLETVFANMRSEREYEINKILGDAEAEAKTTESDANTAATNKVNEGKTEAAAIKAAMVAEVTRIHNEAQAKNVDLYRFLMELDATVASVGGDTKMVINANKYPFNILFKYPEIANPDTMVYDISYMLSQLTEADRALVIDGLEELIAEYHAQQSSGNAGSGTGSGS